MKSYSRFVREINDIKRWFHTTIYSYKTTTSNLSERLNNNENIEQNVNDAFNDVGFNAYSLIHRLSTDNVKMCKELALIRSVSALEVYLIDTIREVYFSNKSPFMKKGIMEYQLGEILSCDNINDLHEKYIEKQCRQLHSGGFEDVTKFYKSRFEIDFSKFNTSVESNNYGLVQIQKYHQKRHLIIHRLGKTDEQYRKKYNSNDTTVKLTENDLAILFKVLLSFAHYVNDKTKTYITTDPPENRVEIKVEIIDDSVSDIFDPMYMIPLKKAKSLPLSILLEKIDYENDNTLTIKLHGVFAYIRKYYKLLKKIESSGKIKVLTYEVVYQVSNKKTIKQYTWSDVEKVIEQLPEKPWEKNIHKKIAHNLGWSNTKVFGIINNIINEQTNALKITPKRKILNIGETYTITLNIENTPVEDVEWKTDNDKVAIISCGTVSAISPGFARISARVPGTANYDVCTIIVCEDDTP